MKRCLMTDNRDRGGKWGEETGWGVRWLSADECEGRPPRTKKSVRCTLFAGLQVQEHKCTN
ncbi:hypothetical protein EON65_26640 [archaeon]|nr:MAG: hypothetical protein EON65_26640 [archaeon]